MKIDLKTLKIFGFFSFDEAQIDLRNQGPVLVLGVNNDDPGFESNGAGKSAIFDALVWCLFGKTLKKIKDADSVVNRHTYSGTMVSLSFACESADYEILRYRKHAKWKNKIRIIKDGSDISASDNSKNEEIIQNLIKLDYETIVATLVMKQRSNVPFAEKTDAEKKRLLDRVLGTEEYERAAIRARKAQSEAQRAVASAKAEKDRLGAENLNIEKRLIDCEDRIKEAEAGYEEEITQAKARAKVVEKKIDQNIRAIGRAEKLETKIRLLGNKLSDLERKAAKMQEKDNTRERKAAKLRASLPLLRDDTSCPTCGQEWEEAAETAKAAKTKRSDLLKKIEKLEKTTNKLQLEEIAKQRQELTSKINKLDSKKAAISTIPQSFLNDQLEAVLEDIERLEDKSRQSTKSVKRLLSELKKERVALVKAVIAARKVVRDLEEEERRLRYWVYAFSPKGIRSLLLDQVIPFLNDEVKRYLKVLADGKVDVEFTTYRTDGSKTDSFEVIITNPYGVDDYKGSSGGETKRIDLCISLALQKLASQRVSSQLGLVVYDEFFVYLDSTALERVVMLLRQECKNGSTTFVCSHDAGLKSHFPNTLTVEKTNGCSTITQH